MTSGERAYQNPWVMLLIGELMVKPSRPAPNKFSKGNDDEEQGRPAIGRDPRRRAGQPIIVHGLDAEEGEPGDMAAYDPERASNAGKAVFDAQFSCVRERVAKPATAHRRALPSGARPAGRAGTKARPQ